MRVEVTLRSQFLLALAHLVSWMEVPDIKHKGGNRKQRFPEVGSDSSA